MTTKKHSNRKIIILLFIFFPAGLYLMWRYAEWNITRKVIITAAIALYSIFYLSAVVGIVAGVSESANDTNEVATNTEANDDKTEQKASPVPNKVDIDAAVANYSDGLVIINRSGRAWKNCEIKVNNGYEGRLNELANDDAMSRDNPNFIAWENLIKNGERFNYLTMKPDNLTMNCYDSPATNGFFYAS